MKSRVLCTAAAISVGLCSRRALPNSSSSQGASSVAVALASESS